MAHRDPFTEPIVVIIATRNRTELLLQRALRSVYAQQDINPHHIYIVDDNPVENGRQASSEIGAIQNGVKALRQEVLLPRYQQARRRYPGLQFENFFHTAVIPNTRTRGKSGTGAWNTAAMHALQYRHRQPFLAILDDDDAWSDEHLATCLRLAKPQSESQCGKRCVAIVSGIKRIEADGNAISMLPEAKSFTEEGFFTGNPGLQGSNTFIELKTFCSIGGFDESMSSCVDRDLAIRLLEQVNLRASHRIAFTNQITVTHYADSVTRVTAIDQAKQHGLDAFYRKYWHRFNNELQCQSLRRAKRLFNYRLPPKAPPSPVATDSAAPKMTATPFNLHIGAISSSQNNTRALLKSFLALHQRDQQWLADYTFHILDNSGCEYAIKPIADYFRQRKGLNIAVLPRQGEHKLDIAASRTRLQQHILKTARRQHGDDFVTWIVDDDALFCADLHTGETVLPDYFQHIAQHRGTDIDAMFGLVSDAPPLPFISTLRTQLLDFHYNLTNFATCDPAATAKPHLLNRWQQDNAESEEFYYDLSSQCFQHLERPLYWQPDYCSNPEMQMHQAFKQFLTATADLATGVNVFRKITFARNQLGELGDRSIYRGGNTIIYNPEMLKIPNYIPNNSYSRRSDFNWAIINRNLYRRKLCQITLPLQHNRKLQRADIVMDMQKFQADIRGMLFYRLLQDMLKNGRVAGMKRDQRLLRNYRSWARQLIRKLKASNHRTVALCQSIEAILMRRRNWWFDNQYRDDLNHLLQQNLALLRLLKFELGKRKLQADLDEIENDLKIDANLLADIRRQMGVF